MSRFDPRTSTSVILNLNDQTTGVAVFPIKTYKVGSNKPHVPVDERGKFKASAEDESVTATLLETQQGTRRFLPVGLCHSYHDHSPIVADGAQDMDEGLKAPVTIRLGAQDETISTTRRPGSAALRSTIKDEDISRIREQELGKQVVPGSPQARLVSGRWRHAAKPVVGDPVYTDFYGPLGGGKETSTYYGRSYHFGDLRNGLRSNKLVEDNAYQRVQASMQGIHTLRTRPGLSIETNLVHQTEETLQPQRPPKAHTITVYHRVHA